MEETVLDARGLLCPLPVIRLGEAARKAPPGVVLALLADDPQVEEDVALWSRGQGHELLEVRREEGFLRLRVRLRAS